MVIKKSKFFSLAAVSALFSTLLLSGLLISGGMAGSSCTTSSCPVSSTPPSTSGTQKPQTCNPQAQMVCAGVAIPTGWIVSFTNQSTDCGSTSLSCNKFLIQRIDNLASRCELNVQLQPVPAGWTRLFTYKDVTLCGASTADNADNMMRIQKN